MKKTGVIIVAGGAGLRMGSPIPKQFLPLCGVPVLAVTLRRFLAALPGSPIVVVLPCGEIGRWRDICREEGLTDTHIVVSGGATRFESVGKGLSALAPCDYVAVHDGVRPLVSIELIKRCISTAERCGTAVPAVVPVDSFRIAAGSGSSVVDRDLLRAVQTPQVFRRDLLVAAYGAEYNPSFTDDASVVESSGVAVTLCEGERSNIKITAAGDMAIAEALLADSHFPE